MVYEQTAWQLTPATCAVFCEREFRHFDRYRINSSARRFAANCQICEAEAFHASQERLFASTHKARIRIQSTFMSSPK